MMLRIIGSCVIAMNNEFRRDDFISENDRYVENTIRKFHQKDLKFSCRELYAENYKVFSEELVNYIPNNVRAIKLSKIYGKVLYRDVLNSIEEFFVCLEYPILMIFSIYDDEELSGHYCLDFKNYKAYKVSDIEDNLYLPLITKGMKLSMSFYMDLKYSVAVDNELAYKNTLLEIGGIIGKIMYRLQQNEKFIIDKIDGDYNVIGHSQNVNVCNMLFTKMLSVRSTV